MDLGNSIKIVSVDFFFFFLIKEQQTHIFWKAHE